MSKEKRVVNGYWIMAIVLWSPLVFALFLTAMSLNAQRSYVRSSDLVLHTIEVRAQLEKMASLFDEFETVTVAYQKSGDGMFLARKESIGKKLALEAQALQELIKDNPRQCENLDELNKLIADSSFSTNSSVDLQNLNSRLGSMFQEEERLLVLRGARSGNQLGLQNKLMISLGALDIVIIIGITLLIRNLQKSRLSAESRTEHANIQMKAAEVREEESIRISETRYRRLFETAQDGILLLDGDTGQVVDANPFMKDLLGYSQKEILGKKLWEIGPFKGMKASKIAFSQLQVSDRIIYQGLPLETKNGKLVEVEFISNAYLVDEKRLIQCNIRDLTERKRSEARFRRLVDSNAQGVIFWNVNGRITGANDAFLTLAGYSRDDLEAGLLSWTGLTPPEFVERDRQSLEEISAKGVGTPYEKEFIRKDGSRVRTMIGAAAFEDTPEEGFCFVVDLTANKRAEEQIVEQAAFLDKAQDAIVVRDLEGNILFWNNGAERMYGWTRREAVGKNILNLYNPEPGKFAEINDIAIKQGEWHGEIQFLTKEKREITIEGRWTVIRDDEGHPKSVLAIDTDITSKKKIEAQFMRAQRMESIGTLAGGIAHDLNNILTPILMSIELLKTSSSDPRNDKILNGIELSAKRGADIVRQVLSFARGVEGERAEIQPRHLLNELGSIIQDTFPKDIRVDLYAPQETCTILGDATQIQQILLNLSVNARDAMPSGGVLSVEMENCTLDEAAAALDFQSKPGRYLKISVTDSGVGMPAGVIDKIFEPFFTTKELNKGTGLGLSTVLAIVKSHGGHINVESKMGQGTTFRIYLPAMDVSSSVLKEKTKGKPLPRGKGETILVVDDEPSIVNIASQTLQSFGYRVLSARDGAEAVAVYAEHKNEIALVLTDILMPIMDGMALISALKRINPLVKVIAASGLASKGGMHRASMADAKHFLAKPYTTQTLLEIIRVTLEERRVK